MILVINYEKKLVKNIVSYIWFYYYSKKNSLVEKEKCALVSKKKREREGLTASMSIL